MHFWDSQRERSSNKELSMKFVLVFCLGIVLKMMGQCTDLNAVILLYTNWLLRSGDEKYCSWALLSYYVNAVQFLGWLQKSQYYSVQSLKVKYIWKMRYRKVILFPEKIKQHRISTLNWFLSFNYNIIVRFLRHCYLDNTSS